MKSVAPALLGVALLLHGLVGGARPAHAQDDYYDDDEEEYGAPEEPEPASADVEDTLSRYGSWTDDDQYGRVWEPAVSVGWAPYVDDGSWAWTPDGWTWDSYEPWGLTFHYGRWVLLPAGWAWVPGSVWGPAWVDWFWGDGFIGWAPLPPFATQVTVINEFVFVHAGDFCAHDVGRHAVNHHLVPDRIIHRWQQRGPGHGRAPSLHRIERVSQHHITRFDRRLPRTIAPDRHFPRTIAPRAPQLVRPAPVGEHHLGRPLPRGLPEARGMARLGQPWNPGTLPRQAPAFVARRVPAPGAPAPVWRLGGAQRPAIGHPVTPRMGLVRTAPQMAPARRLSGPAGHASRTGAPGGHHVVRGGGGDFGHPGAFGLR